MCSIQINKNYSVIGIILNTFGFFTVYTCLCILFGFSDLTLITFLAFFPALSFPLGLIYLKLLYDFDDISERNAKDIRFSAILVCVVTLCISVIKFFFFKDVNYLIPLFPFMPLWILSPVILLGFDKKVLAKLSLFYFAIMILYLTRWQVAIIQNLSGFLSFLLIIYFEPKLRKYKFTLLPNVALILKIPIGVLGLLGSIFYFILL